MLNSARTSLMLATALTLGMTSFATTANAEPTVYEGPNGGVCVNSAARTACQGANGAAAYRGPHRGAVKGPNGTYVYRGVHGSAVKTPNSETYIKTPNGVYKVDRHQ